MDVTPRDPQVIETPPAHYELRQLPRWALLLLSTRCVERIAGSIATAICEADHTAMSIDEILARCYQSCHAGELLDLPSGEDAIVMAASAEDARLTPWVNLLVLADEFKIHSEEHALPYSSSLTAMNIADTACQMMPASARSIWADYKSLMNAACCPGREWSNDTPVSPAFFCSLWDDESSQPFRLER